MPRRRERILGEDLLAQGLVNEDQLRQGLARQRATGEKLGEALVALRHLSRGDLWSVLGAPWVDLEPLCQAGSLPSTALPLSSLRRWQAVPVDVRDDGTLVVAMVDPLDAAYVDEIWRAAGAAVECCAADPAVIARALNEMARQRDETPDRRAAIAAAPTAAMRSLGEPDQPLAALPSGKAGATCGLCGAELGPEPWERIDGRRLSAAWSVALAAVDRTGVPADLTMASWRAEAGLLKELCPGCAEAVREAEEHSCAMCNRPTHVWQGGVLAVLGECDLSALSEEMGLRRFRCPMCERFFCASCGTRHSMTLSAEGVRCPLCGGKPDSSVTPEPEELD